jgi:hypothetical protein
MSEFTGEDLYFKLLELKQNYPYLGFVRKSFTTWEIPHSCLFLNEIRDIPSFIEGINKIEDFLIECHRYDHTLSRKFKQKYGLLRGNSKNQKIAIQEKDKEKIRRTRQKYLSRSVSNHKYLSTRANGFVEKTSGIVFKLELMFNFALENIFTEEVKSQIKYRPNILEETIHNAKKDKRDGPNWLIVFYNLHEQICGYL